VGVAHMIRLLLLTVLWVVTATQGKTSISIGFLNGLIPCCPPHVIVRPKGCIIIS
jgi:hypothetical protein